LDGQRAPSCWPTPCAAGRTARLPVIDDPELEVLRADILAAAARGVAVHALLTGAGALPGKHVAHHPRGESELQELGGSLILVADGARVLIAGHAPELSATVTNNRHLVFVTRQFVWMELFSQRLYARLGPNCSAPQPGRPPRLARPAAE
jgi:Cd2+/Zn2+-exporting ATPase